MLDMLDIDALRLLSSPFEIDASGLLPFELGAEFSALAVWLETGGLRSGGEGVDVMGSEEDMVVVV